jgi:subtilisin family serine protease
MAGTSMASPHFAGAAALLAVQGRDDQVIVDVLKATARKPGTGQRGVYDPSYGYGIVDAEAAVAAP